MRESTRPDPTRDLDTADEIAELVRRFYADVAQDELLGPMFNEVAQVDWSEHLPKLTAFWCRVLLGTPGFAGKPFHAHAEVHRRCAFTAAHFRRWLSLFHETLELGWTGPGADRASELADNIARVHSQQLIGEPVSIPTARRAGGRSGSGSGDGRDARRMSGAPAVTSRDDGRRSALSGVEPARSCSVW